MSNSNVLALIDEALSYSNVAMAPLKDSGEAVSQDVRARGTHLALLKVHRALLDMRREIINQEPPELPRHFRLAIATATRAFQQGDFRDLGTFNEDLQPLVDAAIAWGKR